MKNKQVTFKGTLADLAKNTDLTDKLNQVVKVNKKETQVADLHVKRFNRMKQIEKDAQFEKVKITAEKAKQEKIKNRNAIKKAKAAEKKG